MLHGVRAKLASDNIQADGIGMPLATEDSDKWEAYSSAGNTEAPTDHVMFTFKLDTGTPHEA
jgi:hypothetical protein